MSEERFRLSKFAIPSELSDFCDENGRMLNSEVVRMLNDRDKQQEANIKMFFKYKEQEAEVERLNKLLLNALSYVPIETRVNLLGALKRRDK
jgi:hypothetical protein